MRPGLLSIALFLALMSCCADPHRNLTATARVESIDIYASSPELAARVSAGITQALPYVRQLPGVQCPAHPRFYVAEVPGSDVHGVTYEKFVDITVGSESSELDYLVAHELTHYFILGGATCGGEWHRLPAILEEGLCECIAQQAQPAIGDSVRAQHALLTGTLVSGGIELAPAIQVGSAGGAKSVTLTAEDVDRGEIGVLEHALDYTRTELLAVEPRANRRALTGLGFFLARRIGLDGLRQLVDEARANGEEVVPAARVCAAARLDPNARHEWLTSARDIADGKAYDILLDQARGWAIASSADPTVIHAARRRFVLTWTDAAGNVVGRTMLNESSHHGPVPAGAVDCSWIESP
jgi:hypothetical protein